MTENSQPNHGQDQLPTRPGIVPMVLGVVVVGMVGWHFATTDLAFDNLQPVEDVAGAPGSPDSAVDPVSIDLISASESTPVAAPDEIASPPVPPSIPFSNPQTGSRTVPPPAASSAAALVSDQTIIVVQPGGLKSTKGELRVAVFDSKNGFPNHADAMYTVEFSLSDQSTDFELKGLPPGQYAVAVYHDKNGDDVMNKGAFGIPSESYGFSNNARGTFGPPKFSEASRTFEVGRQVLQINLK